MTYTVKTGDSIKTISERFFGDDSMVKPIVAINNLKDRDLLPGQVIKLPEVEDAEVIEPKTNWMFWGLAAVAVGSVFLIGNKKRKKKK